MPMKIKMVVPSILLGAICAASIVGAPEIASACGGFFCSSPNLPINQAAEKIIFSANANGTVTAVIQIAYQGPAPKFSWLLPISSVPTADQIGVASNLAFQRLQSATNPQYSLTVRTEGTCAEDDLRGSSSTGSGGTGTGARGADFPGHQLTTGRSPSTPRAPSAPSIMQSSRSRRARPIPRKLPPLG